MLGHHPGSVPITKGWFSLSGIGGKGDAVAGFLAAVFVYGGWDGTLYVNEEVKHRRVNPGRAAMIAVALLAVIYTLAQVGFQGVLSVQAGRPANGTALVYVANALGGGFWAKAMALAIALSVIATTGTGIVLGARIVYGMASYRVLPQFLGTVSRRYATPVASSIIVGLLIVILSAVYFLVTSVQNAFFDVIDVTGLLFSIFYILTALAAMVYYRRRVVSGALDFVAVGLLPLGAAGFLGWIFVRSLAEAPWTQRWSFIGIVIAGLVLMFSRGSSCVPRSSSSPGERDQATADRAAPDLPLSAAPPPPSPFLRNINYPSGPPKGPAKHEGRGVLRVGRRPGGRRPCTPARTGPAGASSPIAANSS